LYWIHLPSGSATHGIPPHTDITKDGYVGVASNGLEARLRVHRWSVDDGSKLPVHAAMRKYQEDIRVVEVVRGSPEYCLFIENSLRPLPNIGWNIAPGGGANFLGRNHTEETKEKIRAANTGTIFSEERKKKMSEGRKGIQHTEEAKAKMSAARKGKPMNLTAEQIQAKREYMLTRPPMSEEVRNKISTKNKGRKYSEEDKERMRERRARDYPDWLSMRANKSNWTKAAEMYVFMQENPEHNANTTGRSVGISYNSAKTIYKKLKSGWNPLEDEAWLTFKAEYEKDNYGTQPL
jgi:hypothetical protein